MDIWFFVIVVFVSLAVAGIPKLTAKDGKPPRKKVAELFACHVFKHDPEKVTDRYRHILAHKFKKNHADELREPRHLPMLRRQPGIH